MAASALCDRDIAAITPARPCHASFWQLEARAGYGATQLAFSHLTDLSTVAGTHFTTATALDTSHIEWLPSSMAANASFQLSETGDPALTAALALDGSRLGAQCCLEPPVIS